MFFERFVSGNEVKNLKELQSSLSVGFPNGSAGGMGMVTFFLLLLAGLCVVLGYLKRATTKMAVTNKRVIIKLGHFGRRSFEVLLSQIESIGI
jgi:hypothetical protein